MLTKDLRSFRTSDKTCLDPAVVAAAAVRPSRMSCLQNPRLAVEIDFIVLLLSMALHPEDRPRLPELLILVVFPILRRWAQAEALVGVLPHRLKSHRAHSLKQWQRWRNSTRPSRVVIRLGIHPPV